MWWDTWWERHRGQEEVREGAGTDFYGADRTTDPQHFCKLRSRKKKYCTNCVREKKKLFGASRPSTLFPSARIPFRPNSEPSTVALNPIFGPAQTHIPTVGEPELQREKIRTPAAAPLSLSLSFSDSMATTRDLSAIDMAREAAAPGRTAGKASAPSGHHHAGARGGGGDLWSEIMASGGGGGAARIGVVYGRRRAAQEASRPRGAVDV